jgi:hypothetical protein
MAIARASFVVIDNPERPAERPAMSENGRRSPVTIVATGADLARRA